MPVFLACSIASNAEPESFQMSIGVRLNLKNNFFITFLLHYFNILLYDKKRGNWHGKNVIITISRQFGSNGREIARKLAEYLDISYYNKQILEKIAENMGVCADFLRPESRCEWFIYDRI